jgi:hypothetical protein
VAVGRSSADAEMVSAVIVPQRPFHSPCFYFM